MEVRSLEQRKHDVHALLETEVDAWIATASEEGLPYLVPLSFAWDGSRVILANPARSITTTNLRHRNVARIAVGPTRDVVMIDGHVDIVDLDRAGDVAGLHTRRAGFDARASEDPFVYLVMVPERIQAWRNPAELTGRAVMKDGDWLT